VLHNSDEKLHDLHMQVVEGIDLAPSNCMRACPDLSKGWGEANNLLDLRKHLK
jgi:hypothetical protein